MDKPLVPREELRVLLHAASEIVFVFVNVAFSSSFFLFLSLTSRKRKSSKALARSLALSLARSLRCQPTSRPRPLREGATTAGEEAPLSRPLLLERCRSTIDRRKPSTMGSTPTPRYPRSGPSRGTSRLTLPRRRSRQWCLLGVREMREKVRERERETESGSRN
jgi:hypothetical protein